MNERKSELVSHTIVQVASSWTGSQSSTTVNNGATAERAEMKKLVLDLVGDGEGEFIRPNKNILGRTSRKMKMKWKCGSVLLGGVSVLNLCVIILCIFCEFSSAGVNSQGT